MNIKIACMITLFACINVCSPAYSHVQEECKRINQQLICLPIPHKHSPDTSVKVQRLYTGTGEYQGRMGTDGRMYDSKGKYVGKVK